MPPALSAQGGGGQVECAQSVSQPGYQPNLSRRAAAESMPPLVMHWGVRCLGHSPTPLRGDRGVSTLMLPCNLKCAVFGQLCGTPWERFMQQSLAQPLRFR
jgi:hypothetical protein